MGGHRQTLLAVRLLVLAALCWGQARGVAMTLEDLKKLAELFSGEFDNKIQHEKFALVYMFHVPIEVLALRVTGPNNHLVSRQFYVEEFFNDQAIPATQQILNFVLKQNHIAMESYEHPTPHFNVTAKLEWRMWADDRFIFDNLRVEDLVYDPFCDKRWTKAADGVFVGVTNNVNCTALYSDRKIHKAITTNLTASTLVDDIRYVNNNDNTVVDGSEPTHFVYDRVGYIHPMPARGAGSTLSTCHSVSMVMCWAILVLAISAF